jgi:putative ABC transport system substrate-binding protein
MAWPAAAWAQQSAMPTIGLLGTTSMEAEVRLIPFRQALNEAGYIEGQNVRIVYRWVENHYERFPALAADLVKLQVNVIVSLGGTPGALAAKAATATIPIVFQAGVDPVEAGIVSSLNRPGGNITGVSQLLAATLPKQLQLLHEAVPTTHDIGFLFNQSNPLYSECAPERAGSTSWYTRSKPPPPARQHRKRVRCCLCKANRFASSVTGGRP